MKSADIRRTFLEFFQEHGHEIVPSSPLVPGNDPTLLFTNAGMVQFKDVFTGREQRSYHRAVTSQRCVRAGGSTTTLRTSAIRRATIPSSKCWGISPLGIISSETRFASPGRC